MEEKGETTSSVEDVEYWQFGRTWLLNILLGYTKGIEGRVKTLLESVLTDREQLKATKDIVTQLLWSEWEPMKRALRQYQIVKDEDTFLEAREAEER